MPAAKRFSKALGQLAVRLGLPLYYPNISLLRGEIYRLGRSTEVRRTAATLATKRVGLVLSGGGGKGAYEIGCLRALHALGITSFSAIAGTSVGALNAALVAQGGLPTAKSIWKNLGYGDVLRTRPIRFIFALLARFLLAPMFLIQSQPSVMEAVSQYGSLLRLGFPKRLGLVVALEPLGEGLALFWSIGNCVALLVLVSLVANVAQYFSPVTLIFPASMTVLLCFLSSCSYYSSLVSRGFSGVRLLITTLEASAKWLLWSWLVVAPFGVVAYSGDSSVAIRTFALFSMFPLAVFALIVTFDWAAGGSAFVSTFPAAVILWSLIALHMNLVFAPMVLKQALLSSPGVIRKLYPLLPLSAIFVTGLIGVSLTERERRPYLVWSCNSVLCFWFLMFAFLPGRILATVPALSSISLLLIVLVAVASPLWFMERRFHNKVAEKLSLFSNQPLENLVKINVKPEKIRSADIPVFVTLAGLDWVLKPFDEGVPQRMLLRSFLNYSLQYVPTYQDLRLLADCDIGRYVIQSAAIPEAFPRKVLDGRPVIDGGMADNSPILPVWRDGKTEAIVVIYLQRPASLFALLEEEKYRLIGLSKRVAGSGYGEKESSPAWALRPQDILAIVPSQNLGGLLTGTMNFSACKARRLMWLGYFDTLSALRDGAVQVSWGSSWGDAIKTLSVDGLKAGLAALKRGDLDEAIRLYTRALNAGDLSPDNQAEALNERGTAYGNKREYDMAIADYDAAIRLKEDFAEPYISRGFAYTAKGEYDRAIADYDAGIRLKPDLAVAYYYRAIANFAKKEYEKGIADCDTAIALDPQYIEAYDGRGNAFMLKCEYDKAIAQYDAIIDLKPDNALAYFHRALVYVAKGENDKAMADYKTAVSLNPELVKAYEVRAQAESKANATKR